MQLGHLPRSCQLIIFYFHKHLVVWVSKRPPPLWKTFSLFNFFMLSSKFSALKSTTNNSTTISVSCSLGHPKPSLKTIKFEEIMWFINREKSYHQLQEYLLKIFQIHHILLIHVLLNLKLYLLVYSNPTDESLTLRILHLLHLLIHPVMH